MYDSGSCLILTIVINAVVMSVYELISITLSSAFASAIWFNYFRILRIDVVDCYVGAHYSFSVFSTPILGRDVW